MKAPFLILGERRKARNTQRVFRAETSCALTEDPQRNGARHVHYGLYEESKLSQGMSVEGRSERWRQSVSINVKQYRLKTYVGI